MSFTINIIGKDYSDTILYFSRILQCMGEHVLIHDNTADRELACCIPDIEGIDTEAVIQDYRGVGYCSGSAAMQMAEEEGYDTVLELYDIEEIPSLAGPVIIITDEHKLNVDMLNKLNWTRPLVNSMFPHTFTGRPASDRYLIVRGFTGRIRSQFNELLVSADISRMFRIPHSLHDEVCAVLAMYRDVYSFIGISSDYSNALIEIVQELRPDIDDRTVLKAYNMAAGGKVWAV